MNWVAPCTIKASDLELQATVASVLLGGCPSNVGLLLTPLFAYKPGGVLKEELNALGLLQKKNLNMDRCFALLFRDKPDARDNRPASYNGRLVLSSCVKENESAYRTSRLFQLGYTEMAEQLAPRDMAMIEAMAKLRLSEV